MTEAIVYKSFFITQGIGEDDDQKILAFDKALMMAGINQYNIISVSSMLPCGAKLISKASAVMKTGEIIFCVMARLDGRLGEAIYSGIGFALGYDKSTGEEYGFVLEGSSKVSEGFLKDQLVKGLDVMANLRNFSIQESDIFLSGIKKIENNFGSSIVALVYR